MVDPESVTAMWSALAEARPDLAPVGASYSAWHFCDNEADANELADLVLSGTKRATASLLWSYEVEGESLPEVGDLSIVTDWDGRARCVIRTISVEVVPFEAVTQEFAATEGEGDRSLDYWRAAHAAAFTRELAGSRRAFEPSMLVVCERFEVVIAGPKTP